MHLSKSTAAVTAKPSLSQLAQLRNKATTSTAVPPITHSAMKKPNLAELAQMNLSKTSSSSSSINRSTVASLGSGAQTENKSVNLSNTLRSLSLSKAKTTHLSVSATKAPAVKILQFDASVDSVLIAGDPSPLGRVLVSGKHQNVSVFTKFDLKRRLCDRAAVKVFDFSTPSPDDLIRRRLQHNY